MHMHDHREVALTMLIQQNVVRLDISKKEERGNCH